MKTFWYIAKTKIRLLGRGPLPPPPRPWIRPRFRRFGFAGSSCPHVEFRSRFQTARTRRIQQIRTFTFYVPKSTDAPVSFPRVDGSPANHLRCSETVRVAQSVSVSKFSISQSASITARRYDALTVSRRRQNTCRVPDGHLQRYSRALVRLPFFIDRNIVPTYVCRDPFVFVSQSNFRIELGDNVT